MADFLDKMKDGINKGVATVSTGSKAMIEKTKINSLIRTLEDEKKQLAELLGSRVYNFCIENNEGDIPRSEVAALCEKITQRSEETELQKKKLEELEKEINQVRGTSVGTLSCTCPLCGNVNKQGAKFCARCGGKLL